MKESKTAARNVKIVLQRLQRPKEAISLPCDPAKGELLEIQKLSAHAAQITER